MCIRDRRPIGGISLSEPKKQNYLPGAAILAAGVVIMKILGFIYKVPLDRKSVV